MVLQEEQEVLEKDLFGAVCVPREVLKDEEVEVNVVHHISSLTFQNHLVTLQLCSADANHHLVDVRDDIGE